MKHVLKFPSTRFAVAASASLVAFALLAMPGTAQAEGDRKATPGATNVDRSVPKDPARGGADTTMLNQRGSDTASGTMRDRTRRDTATMRDSLPPDSNYVPVRPGF